MSAPFRRADDAQSPSIIDRIYDRVDDMPKAMSRIALYVSQNADQVIEQSIGQLGENTGSGHATIVRFCKYLGFQGFKELKIALAREVAREKAYREQRYSRFASSKGDKDLDRLSAALHSSIDITASLIEVGQVDTIAARLAACRRVDIYGAGVSGICAQILAVRLLRLGLPVSFSQSGTLALEVVSALSEGDLAIAISFSGVTEETIAFLRTAAATGAHTVAITTRANSKLAKQAAETVLLSQEGPWPTRGAVRLVPGIWVFAEFLAERLENRTRG